MSLSIFKLCIVYYIQLFELMNAESISEQASFYVSVGNDTL